MAQRSKSNYKYWILPMIVGILQTPRPRENPKVMTARRIATVGRPIPVTVGPLALLSGQVQGWRL